MKAKFLLSCFVLGCLPALASAQLVMNLNTEFSGATDPVGTQPWLTATFTQTDALTVSLSLSAANLDTAQKVTTWGFNFDDTKDVTGLMASPGPGTDPVAAFTANANGVNLDGGSGHGFDFAWDFNTSGNTFAGGESQVFTLTYDVGDPGNDPLSINDFNFTNKVNQSGDFYSAAHVQSIPPSGDSGWIRADAAVIPEPSTYALIIGSACLGLVVWKRRRAAKSSEA